MKPGDLVEFKAGLFGIAPPKNLGIYVERVKRKKDFFVVLHTVKGRREVKPDNVTGRRFSARVDVAALSEADLTERLHALVKEHSGTPGKKEKPQVPPGEMNDRVLWNKVWEAGDQTPEEMAAAYFDDKVPARKQVEQVRDVLKTCARPGVGYFERLPGRGESWRPITLDAFKAIKREEEGLNRLRKKLVKVVEEEDPETGWVESWYEGVKVRDADLDEEDERRLREIVVPLMDSFIHHDENRGEVGLAGTGVHTIDGFNLFGWARWLAQDWTGTQRASLSSVFVEFLVTNGLWTQSEAVIAIAKRKVAKHPDFDWETPADMERAAARCPADLPADEVARRTDLRHLTAYTIDPADAKDHDDAVSLVKHEDGSRTLYVHIADVSWYVEKDSPLDYHAKRHATSVYLPTGVLPMLPHRLADDLCSLNEGVDRFAMTAALTFDGNLELVEEAFFESVIRVDVNIAYEGVLDAIEDAERSGTGNPYAELEAFARELDAKRRGLVLETGERRVTVTPEAADISHVLKHGNRATKMIEVFMVTANEAVARKLTRDGVPTPYRCHPLPDREGVRRFNKQMVTMALPLEIELPEPGETGDGGDAGAGAEADDDDGGGPSILDQLKKGGKVNLFGSGGFAVESDEPEEKEETAEAEPEAAKPSGGGLVLKGLAQLSPEDQEAWLAPFRDVLGKVKDLDDERVRGLVYLKTLSCMGRAVYTPQNMGHFGLGSTCYTHFTSPIRRYADLVVHRQLRAVLRGEDPPHGDDLEDVSQHCTDQSQAAESLERQMVDAAMVFVSLNGDWDGDQEALVNGLAKGGVFMSLHDGLEARLGASDIPGGPWAIDEAESMLFKGAESAVEEEVTAANWRDLYNPDLDEMVRVAVRLGDVMRVRIVARDFVDGKVSAKLAAEGDAGAS